MSSLCKKDPLLDLPQSMSHNPGPISIEWSIIFFVRHSTCAVCAQLAVGKQLKNALNIAWRNPSFESTLWTKAHATAEFG